MNYRNRKKKKLNFALYEINRTYAAFNRVLTNKKLLMNST